MIGHVRHMIRDASPPLDEQRWSGGLSQPAGRSAGGFAQVVGVCEPVPALCCLLSHTA